MATQSNREKQNQGSMPPTFLGYPIPENLADKAGPFLLGMITTYVLQAVMPGILHYTLITVQFLRVAFLWILLAVAVCWYTGIGVAQAGDFQASISRIRAQFSQKPEPISSPNRQFHLQSAESRAGNTSNSSSPTRSEPSKDEIPVLSLRPSPELSHPRNPEKIERKASPTINVRPFLAPIRDEYTRSKSEYSIPQRRVSAPRPIPERNSTETLISRKIAYPQKSHMDRTIPRKPLQPVTPAQSQQQELEQLKFEAETAHLRKFVHPRRPSRQPSHGHKENSIPNSNSNSNAKSAVASFNSRRNSTDSLGSTQKSLNSNKPLPLVVDNSQGNNDRGHLTRSDSVVSKQSVLGTRANYSKFLANVDT